MAHFFGGESWKFESLFLSFFGTRIAHWIICIEKSTHFFFFFAVETLNKGGKTGRVATQNRKKGFYITSIHLATLECVQYTLVALILLLLFRAIQGEELQEIFFQVRYGLFDSFNRSVRAGWGGGDTHCHFDSLEIVLVIFFSPRSIPLP